MQPLKRKAPTSFVQSAAQRQAVALENKRIRTTKEKLEARLFKLFEEQASWTLKQLGDATQQPQVCRLQLLSCPSVILCASGIAHHERPWFFGDRALHLTPSYS